MGVHLWSGRLYTYAENHRNKPPKVKRISKTNKRKSGLPKKNVKTAGNKNNSQPVKTKEREYVICPNCNHKIRRGKYRAHIERKCPVLTRDKPKPKKEKVTVQRQPNRHICPSCVHYDGEKGNCSLSRTRYKAVFRCLLYKQSAGRN